MRREFQKPPKARQPVLDRAGIQPQAFLASESGLFAMTLCCSRVCWVHGCGQWSCPGGRGVWMGGSEEPHGVCACPGVCEVTETGWTTRKKEHLKDMEGPVRDVMETREWG